MVDNEDNVIDELLKEISGLITEYPKAIERRAFNVSPSY